MVVSSTACLFLRLFSPVLLSFPLPVYSALILSLRVAVFFSVWFLVTGDQLSLVFLDPCEIKDEFIEVVETTPAADNFSCHARGIPRLK